MRKHAGSWMIKVILGVIVVVFVFWGVGSRRAQQRNRVAVVNGSPISLDEYRSVYDRMLEQYRRQFGDALDQKLIKTLNLRRQTLDHLIERRLSLQQAERLGLRVTNEALAGAIQKVPAFQYNGQFDPRQYKRVLSRSGMTPEIFEESVKQDLLVEKMEGIVVAGIKVSDAEALETFKWREEQVSVDYVAFRPASYEGVTVTPEELETYYGQHKKEYEIPPKIKVSYVCFAFKDFAPEVEVSEEEINQYFDLNREGYGSPKKVWARHILFKVEGEADEETIEEARKKALSVLEQAKAGADFAELAKKHSDDPGSKNKGGDLGFFEEGKMVKPFSDAAFSMQPGEISDPVRTPFGWHLIKVEEVQKAKEPALDSGVKQEIRAKLVQDGARTLAYDRAEEMYEACYGPGHIADEAMAQELEMHETGFFARGDRVEGIEESGKFAGTAFDLADDEISDVLELADGYYILEVTARKPAEIPMLESVKEKVRKDLIVVRQGELARKAAEEFLDALTEGAAFEEEAERRGLKIKSTELFKRFGSIPGIGAEQEITDTAFSLEPSAPLAERVVKGKKDFYVIRLKERKEADLKAFEARKEETKRSLFFQKRQKLLDAWFDQLRQKSEIEIEEGFLS
jgi:peptidyl-prolyl cis-trans isomerase D